MMLISIAIGKLVKTLKTISAQDHKQISKHQSEGRAGAHDATI